MFLLRCKGWVYSPNQKSWNVYCCVYLDVQRFWNGRSVKEFPNCIIRISENWLFWKLTTLDTFLLGKMVIGRLFSKWPSFLWILQLYHNVRKILLLVPTTSPMLPVHTLIASSLNTVLILYYPDIHTYVIQLKFSVEVLQLICCVSFLTCSRMLYLHIISVWQSVLFSS